MVWVRYFDLEERIKLQALLKDGFGIPRISKEMNRSMNGLHHEIKKNGGRELYDAHKAHVNRRINVKCGGSEQLSFFQEEPLKKVKEVAIDSSNKVEESTIESRLEILEMQVNILCETIRELNAKNK